MPARDSEYVAAVLDIADRVPPGRAITYGLIAEVLRGKALAARHPLYPDL